MKSLCSHVLVLGTILGCGCRTTEPPANPTSSAGTKAVLDYIRSLESRTEKRMLSGQFCGFGGGANLRLMEQIHGRTGHWPAMLGVDYAGRGGIACVAPNAAAIEYWRQGGLVTVSAHLYNPANPNGGGLRDKAVDLNSLLEANSETHARWMAEMDRVAEGLKELKEAGVVVLWRPFHEMNGDWFWWCDHDPDVFIRLWRQMFDYFTVTKGLDNLLWVYGPNHGRRTAAYYPGDGYVDLIGLDAYTDYIDTNHIRGYAELARIQKPFGFTEFGPHSPQNPPGDYDYLRFLRGVQQNFPRTVFFMSWNDKWSLASNTNTTELLNQPWIVNREDLPKGLGHGG